MAQQCAQKSRKASKRHNREPIEAEQGQGGIPTAREVCQTATALLLEIEELLS